MGKNGVNGNGNKNGNGNQRFCSVCFMEIGTHQKDVVPLPGGGFAEQSCLLEKMNRSFIVPAKKVTDFDPAIGSPRKTMLSIIEHLQQYQKTPGIPELLEKARDFSSKFLGIGANA